MLRRRTLNVNLSVSNEFASLLRDFRNEIKVAIKQTEIKMVQRIEALRSDFATYVAAVTAFMLSVDAAVEVAKAQAVLDDDAAESAVIDQLTADIAAAKGALPVAPVEPPVEEPPVEEPPFNPSDNG
jgi:hypothetical protein